MSRSGYVDDYDDMWQLIRWRGAVKSALTGRRGQSFLRELIAALDALPSPRLIPHELEQEGEFCALGAVGRARGTPLAELDPEDIEGVAGTFDIARAMACEIVYENDESGPRAETPEHRFTRIRNWATSQLKESQS